MDAKVAASLGEWQSELHWVRGNLPEGCELEWSRREHLEDMLNLATQDLVGPSAWAPWVTLAVVIRYLRSHGCTGEHSPKLFQYGTYNPKVEWQEVLAATLQGRSFQIIQTILPNPRYNGQILTGDGRLWIVYGASDDYRYDAVAELVTLNVLTHPEHLVRWNEQLMSLEQFLAQAAQQGPTATAN